MKLNFNASSGTSAWIVPVFEVTSADSILPTTSTAPASVSTLSRDRTGTRTVRSMRSRSRRSLTSMLILLPLATVVTSVGFTAAPVDLASMVILFCMSSAAITLTFPLRLLIVSERLSPVTISVVKP
jgi:hypothetical protein